MSGLPDVRPKPEGLGSTYQANHECTWYNCYVPYSPSLGMGDMSTKISISILKVLDT